MTGMSRLRASALANPTGHYITAGVGTRDPPHPPPALYCSPPLTTPELRTVHPALNCYNLRHTLVPFRGCGLAFPLSPAVGDAPLAAGDPLEIGPSGINTYTLLYVKQVINKDLRHGTGALLDIL